MDEIIQELWRLMSRYNIGIVDITRLINAHREDGQTAVNRGRLSVSMNYLVGSTNRQGGVTPNMLESIEGVLQRIISEEIDVQEVVQNLRPRRRRIQARCSEIPTPNTRTWHVVARPKADFDVSYLECGMLIIADGACEIRLLHSYGCSIIIMIDNEIMEVPAQDWAHDSFYYYHSYEPFCPTQSVYREIGYENRDYPREDNPW